MRLFLALLLILAPLHAEVDTGPLADWLNAQTKVKSLEADFNQERRLPALKNPVKTPGSLTMTREGKMRWELGEPAKTVAVSDGQNITLIDIAKKQANTMSADSPRARPFTMLSNEALRGGMDGFTQAFELVKAETVDGIYQLTTKPKDSKMRRNVKWVFFYIDPKKDELRAMAIELDDKSHVYTSFSNVRFNRKIPDSRFQYDLSGFDTK